MAVLSVGVIVTLAAIGASIIAFILLYCLCRSKNPIYDHTCVATLQKEEKPYKSSKQSRTPQKNGKKQTQIQIQGSRKGKAPKFETKIVVENEEKLQAKRGSKKGTKYDQTKDKIRGSRIEKRAKETMNEAKKTDNVDVNTKRGSKKAPKPYEIQVEIRKDEPLESRPKEILRQSSATLPEKCPLSVNEPSKKSNLRESTNDKTKRPEIAPTDTVRPARKSQEAQPHYLRPNSIEEKTLSARERRDKFARSKSYENQLQNSRDQTDGGTTRYVRPKSLDLQNGKAVFSRDHYVSPRSIEESHRFSTSNMYPRTLEPEERAKRERDGHYVKPRSFEQDETIAKRRENEKYYVSPRSFELDGREINDRESYYVRPRSFEREERKRQSDKYYVTPRSIELEETARRKSESYYMSPRSLGEEKERLRRESHSYYVTPRSLEMEEKRESYYVSPRSFDNENQNGEIDESYYVKPRTLGRDKSEERDKRDRYQRSSQTMRPRSAARNERKDYYKERPSTSRRPRSAERADQRQERGLTDSQRSASYYMTPSTLEKEERDRREMREIKEWKEKQEMGRIQERVVDKRSERGERQGRDGTQRRSERERSGERERTERKEKDERERSQEREREKREGTRSRSRERSGEGQRREGTRKRDGRDRSDGRERREGTARSRSRERREERHKREGSRGRDGRDRTEGTMGRDEKYRREGREKSEERRERSEERRKAEEIRGRQDLRKRDSKQENHEKKERPTRGERRRGNLSRSLSDKRSSDREEDRRKLTQPSPTSNKPSRARTRSHSISEYIPSTAERKKRQVHVIHRTKSWASRPTQHYNHDDSPPASPRTIHLEFHPRSGDVTPKDTKSSVSTEPDTVVSADIVKVESQPILAYEVPTYPYLDVEEDINSEFTFQTSDSRRSSGGGYKTASSANSIINGYESSNLNFNHERTEKPPSRPHLEKDGEKTVVSGSLVIEYDTLERPRIRTDRVDGNVMSKSADFLDRTQGVKVMNFSEDFRELYSENKTANSSQKNQKAVPEKRIRSEQVITLRRSPKMERQRPRSSISSDDVDWHLFTVDGKKVDSMKMRSEPALQNLRAKNDAKGNLNGLDWQLYTPTGERLAKEKRESVTSQQSQTVSRTESKSSSVTQSPAVSRNNSKRSSVTEAGYVSHNEIRSKGSVRASLESHFKKNERPLSRNRKDDQPVIFSFE